MRLAALLLVGCAALVVGDALVMGDKQSPRSRQRLALRQPVSLAHRFADSGYRGAEQRFAFYQLSARFEGARLLAPSSLLQRHRWYLERVGGLSIELTRSELAAPTIAGRPAADFEGQLDGRKVLFWSDPGARYALVEAAPDGPLLWIPTSWLERGP